MNSMNNEKGITLIELILTLFIVSILVAISIPKSSFISNYKEKKELMEFKKDIVYARNKAVCEVGLYKIDIWLRRNYYVVYKLAADGWELVKRKEFKSRLKFKSNYPIKTEIIFNSSGAPNKGNSIFLLNGKGQTIKMTILPATGKVNVYIDEET